MPRCRCPSTMRSVLCPVRAAPLSFPPSLPPLTSNLTSIPPLKEMFSAAYPCAVFLAPSPACSPSSQMAGQPKLLGRMNVAVEELRHNSVQLWGEQRALSGGGRVELKAQFVPFSDSNEQSRLDMQVHAQLPEDVTYASVCGLRAELSARTSPPRCLKFCVFVDPAPGTGCGAAGGRWRAYGCRRTVGGSLVSLESQAGCAEHHRNDRRPSRLEADDRSYGADKSWDVDQRGPSRPAWSVWRGLVRGGGACSRHRVGQARARGTIRVGMAACDTVGWMNVTTWRI